MLIRTLSILSLFLLSSQADAGWRFARASSCPGGSCVAPACSGGSCSIPAGTYQAPASYPVQQPVQVLPAAWPVTVPVIVPRPVIQAQPICFNGKCSR
jgi:hypothetical protein